MLEDWVENEASEGRWEAESDDDAAVGASVVDGRRAGWGGVVWVISRAGIERIGLGAEPLRNRGQSAACC